MTIFESRNFIIFPFSYTLIDSPFSNNRLLHTFALFAHSPFSLIHPLRTFTFFAHSPFRTFVLSYIRTFADSHFRNSYIRIPEAETKRMRKLIFLVTLQGIFVIS
jgi:hypothetical protein